MARQKQTVVSFRVDHHLAEILNHLPDKSGFIRDAILQRFHAMCPFCRGRGVMPQVIARWFEGQLPEYQSVECRCCHYLYPVEVLSKARPPRGQSFICPHCLEHGHSH